jgi:uncharacterized membrane protein YccC
VVEIIGWFQIVLSPTLIGIGLGFLIYLGFPNILGTVIAISAGIIGFIFGVRLATKKFKTTGTINFLSKVSATPELDEKKNDHLEPE